METKGERLFSVFVGFKNGFSLLNAVSGVQIPYKLMSNFKKNCVIIHFIFTFYTIIILRQLSSVNICHFSLSEPMSPSELSLTGPP